MDDTEHHPIEGTSGKEQEANDVEPSPVDVTLDAKQQITRHGTAQVLRGVKKGAKRRPGWERVPDYSKFPQGKPHS